MRAANLRALETLVTGPQDGEALLPEGSIAARARYLPPSARRALGAVCQANPRRL